MRDLPIRLALVLTAAALVASAACSPKAAEGPVRDSGPASPLAPRSEGATPSAEETTRRVAVIETSEVAGLGALRYRLELQRTREGTLGVYHWFENGSGRPYRYQGEGAFVLVGIGSAGERRIYPPRPGGRPAWYNPLGMSGRGGGVLRLPPDVTVVRAETWLDLDHRKLRGTIGTVTVADIPIVSELDSRSPYDPMPRGWRRGFQGAGTISRPPAQPPDGP